MTRPDLHAVRGSATPVAPTTAPTLPPEKAPTDDQVPDLLAALDAGDDAAVWAWFRAHVPEPDSLAVYGVLLGAGLIGLLEWPAVALSALTQLVVDRRFGGVEKVAAQLRARVDALSAARP